MNRLAFLPKWSHPMPGLLGLSLLLFTMGTTVADNVQTTQKAPQPPSTTTPSDPKDLKQIATPYAVDPDKPTFRMGLPMWASAISGQVGIKGVVSNVSYISVGNLVSHLDYIIPASFEVESGKWGVLLEGQYTKLSESFSTDIGPTGRTEVAGSVQMQQAFADLNLSYKVIDTDKVTLAPFIGTRFEYVKVSGSIGGNKPFIPSINESGSQAWADPILGFNASYQVFKPASLVAKADVGGFGAASKLTYELFIGSQVQLTRNMYMNGGYRYLSTDYSHEGFTYNLAFQGPQITFGVNF